jgi:hypothetical protein
MLFYFFLLLLFSILSTVFYFFDFTIRGYEIYLTITSFLFAILAFNLSAIPTFGSLSESVLKAVFITAVISVLFLLHRLDRLKLFKRGIGIESAEDVLNIFAGKK